MVKTTIIGASGFIGRHLFKKYRETAPETIGTRFSHGDTELRPFDICRPDLKAIVPTGSEVRAVIIASAKPNIGYCEQHREEAFAVNVAGTLELVRQAVNLGLQPIFLSTDYVFDGRAGHYDDAAVTCPTTEYGRQKQAVENEIPALTDNYLILRLSKIYGTQKGDGTLLDEIASALTAGKEVRAATDQIFSPTHVDDLVRAIVSIQELGLRGTINVCAPESISRCDVAICMARSLGLPDSRVAPISLHDLPGMEDRPLNTSMTCPRLTAEVGQTFAPLQGSIDAVAAQWKNTL
ncbi:MAG: SDR family oxidoreductase [Verrucomicrobiae bacterium]